MCGTGAGSHSVAGVTQSGIDAAKAVLNCRTRELLTQNRLFFLKSFAVDAHEFWCKMPFGWAKGIDIRFR